MSGAGEDEGPTELPGRDVFRRYWAVIPFILVIWSYSYVFDFVYDGHTPSILPGQKHSGLLCQLEFENVKDTYESFFKFYKLLDVHDKDGVYLKTILDEPLDELGAPHLRDGLNAWKPSEIKTSLFDKRYDLRLDSKARRHIQRQIEFLQSYGMATPVERGWSLSPAEFVLKYSNIFGYTNADYENGYVSCGPQNWWGFGVKPTIEVHLVSTDTPATGGFQSDQNLIYIYEALFKSSDGQNNRSPKVEPLNLFDGDDNFGSCLAITPLARFFGLLIALAYVLCCSYYALTKWDWLLGEYKRSKWTHLSIIFDVIVLLIVLVVCFSMLQVATYSALAALPIFCLFLGRWYAEGPPWISAMWGPRRNWRRVFGSIGHVVFEPAGMIFPLFGILGTFLGLALALSDRGLLHIIQSIGDGNAMPADQWAALLKGVGAAIFASMFATFSAIWARFAGGCFGLEPETKEPCEPVGGAQHETEEGAKPKPPGMPGGAAAEAESEPPLTPAGGGGNPVEPSPVIVEKLDSLASAFTVGLSSLADDLKSALKLSSDEPIRAVRNIETDRVAANNQIKEMIREARDELRSKASEIAEQNARSALLHEQLVAQKENRPPPNEPGPEEPEDPDDGSGEG